MTCRFPDNTPGTGYKYGCRCPRCKAVNEAWSAEKKRRYAGVCETCGGRTYSGTKGTAPTLCRSCLEWSDDTVIAAMQDWAERNGGAPPTNSEWRIAAADHPAAGMISDRARRSGRPGWNDLLLLAGFELRCDRRPETQAAVEGMLREGRSTAEIAQHFGWTASNVRKRLQNRGLCVGDLRAA